MITKNNIIPFISYLFFQKNKTVAPQALLDKWAAVPEAEIAVQLQNLYTHWHYTTQQQEQTIQQFLLQNKSGVIPPSPKNSQSVYPSSPHPIVPQNPKKSYTGLIFLALFIPLAYVTYQFYLFNNLKNVYAITNNLSVRNDSNVVIGRMDLQPPTKVNVHSFESLKAVDDNIYERTIDNTGKPKKHRKVMIGAGNFVQFILKSNENIAFVNANFITDSKQEFEQYKSVFGQLNAEEANQLELRFRKVIIGSLGYDENLQGKYIMNACASSSKDVRKKMTSILKQEIIANTRFAVIARLSDGYYYRFFGDLAENSFAKPKKIGIVENPESDADCLTGDLFFKYLPKEKVYGVFDCNGKNLNLYSVLDTQNRVMYFKQPAIPRSFLEDLIDTIKSNLPDIPNLNL